MSAAAGYFSRRVMAVPMTADLIAAAADAIERDYIAAGGELSRLAIVFGGRRPALFLKRELSRRLGRTFLPPAFYSQDEYSAALVNAERPFKRLAEIDAAYIIYTIARSAAPAIVRGRESFAQFLPWALEIASFIDQCDRDGISASRLVSVEKNAAIGYDVPDTVNTLLRHVAVIRDRFHAAMEEQRSFTPGYCARRAAALAPAAPAGAHAAVLFCNVFYLHRTELAIVSAAVAAGKGAVVCQGSSADWPVLASLGRALSADIRPEEPAGRQGAVRLYAGYDTHSQAALVREIVKTIAAPDRSALILPDAAALVPVLSEVAPVVPSLNVSLGYPLQRSSLYSLFAGIFAAQNTRRNGAYYTKDYLAVMRHPLVKNLRLPFDPSVTRVLLHKIEESLIGVEDSPLAGSLFISPETVAGSAALYAAARDLLHRMDSAVPQEELAGALRAIHRILLTAWEDIATFRAFAAAFREALDFLQEKSFLTSYPLNIKALERMRLLADEFAAASFADEPFPADEIFRIAAARLAGEMVSFSGSPLQGFQILGFLESRSLNFDDVVIMDVNESVLPSVTVREPLIPRDVMAALGLTRVTQEEEIQRYHFMRLIAGAQRVHLVYAENKKHERSRFIEELLWEQQKKDRALTDLPVTRPALAIATAPARSSIPKTPAMIETLLARQFSATAVNTYLNCPKSFFFKYLLGLKEHRDIADEPEQRDLGTFIHAFLCEVFSEFTGRQPVLDQAFETRYLALLDTRFAERFAGRMKAESFLVREVVVHRLKHFLAAERTREIAAVAALEQGLAGTLAVAGRQVRFRAQVDRIDRLPSGELLILDYKTGATDALPGSVPALASMAAGRAGIKRTVQSFQLPLYAALAAPQFPGSILNAALYDLRSGELKPYFRAKEQSPELRERKQAACMAALSRLLEELLDPSVPFTAEDEDRSTCSSCPYFYACR